MSFWAKIGVVIKADHLECFEQACEACDLIFDQDNMMIYQKQGRGYARLVEADGGYQIYTDVDEKWNALTKQLGKEYGPLLQGYSKRVVKKVTMEIGGAVFNQEEQPDGSILLYVGV